MRNNRVCETCGTPFYSKVSHEKEKCCSKDCRMRRLHTLGKMIYWKCVEEECRINLESWLKEKYIGEKWTVKQIAQYFLCARTTINRWLKMYGMTPRSISADNKRRYEKMTVDQKREQVKSANISMREKFKDDDWKSEQCRKVLSAQNFNESMPERMFKDALYEAGIVGWIPQYQDHWWSVDVAFPDKKIAIEIDGQFWHTYPKVVEKDARKNKWFESRGWRVIHFNADTIDADIVSYIDKVQELLETA